MTLRRQLALLVLTALTGLMMACSEKEKILKGERIDVRVPLSESVDRVSDPDVQEVTYLDFQKQENQSLPVALPNMRSHPVWPQLNGGASHRIQHPAMRNQVQRIWSVDIGSGNSSDQRITATPVAAEGFIFTMDSQSLVSAISENGQTAWSVSLVPPFEQKDDTSGGGLAYDGGVLFVTTGFGYLYALRASNGMQLWLQKFDAPASFAPTVIDNVVLLVTQDGQAWAVNRNNGRLVQNWQSIRGAASVASGSTPAAQENFAIIPFPSGEVWAADYKTGSIDWRVTVGGARDTSARSSFRSITSAPVIDNDRVYVGNHAGKMAAIDFASGTTIWTASEGSYSPVWPVGGSVFVVSDAGELVRLSATTGERIWGVALPEFKGGSFFGGRKAVYANYGPILAGARILVASGDGKLRFFSPRSGQLLSVVEMGSGAAVAPIIVRGILYTVNDNGTLNAYQ